MEYVWYDVLLNSYNGYTLDNVPSKWRNDVATLIKNAFKNGRIDKTKYNIMMGNNNNSDDTIDEIEAIISEYL